MRELFDGVRMAANELINWVWRKVVGVPLQGHPEDEPGRECAACEGRGYLRHEFDDARCIVCDGSGRLTST